MLDAPLHPAGPHVPEERPGASRRADIILQIESAPAALRHAIAGLSPEQLSVRYRNWSIRQIVHHIADSHVHSYIRFKWTLTEHQPVIKAYEEGDWVALQDSLHGDTAAPLTLLEGVHLKWVQLLRTMTGDQFDRSFTHPQTRQSVTLHNALSYYAWHSRHHTAQIMWLREHRGLA